jgi:hypothetical protein
MLSIRVTELCIDREGTQPVAAYPVNVTNFIYYKHEMHTLSVGASYWYVVTVRKPSSQCGTCQHFHW